MTIAELRDRAATLALLRSKEANWSAVADRIEASGSALAVLTEPPTGQLDFLAGEDGVEASLAKAEADIVTWETEGLHFATLLDPDYPAQLLTIHQRPPFVMWRGTPDAADARGVAIVGTRNATPEGIELSSTIARGLAERGIPVISGLAAGIDTAAHLGALAGGGRTVAVVGTGLRRAYPPENAGLQARIAAAGMVLSQFLPDAAPTRWSFPMRNAVMSGYAAATVVVEASWRSGARMQARLALQHGRPVFLMRSLLVNEWAREYAARPGATLVDNVDELSSRLADIMASTTELVWA